MVTTQYWSGGAYHLGAHQAVKFTAKACSGTPPRKPSHDPADYLHADLAAAAKQGMCMTFYVQFQFDPEVTPIENASKEWTEDALRPSSRVGDIVMPPQDIDHPQLEVVLRRARVQPVALGSGAQADGSYQPRPADRLWVELVAPGKSGPEPVPFGESVAPLPLPTSAR